MPLLDACLQRRVRLLDYECITETGERGGPRCVSRCVCGRLVKGGWGGGLSVYVSVLCVLLILLSDHDTTHDTPSPPTSQKRLVYFGAYAGMAGMIDALQALGQNLLARGFNSPFLHCPAAYM